MQRLVDWMPTKQCTSTKLYPHKMTIWFAIVTSHFESQSIGPRLVFLCIFVVGHKCYVGRGMLRSQYSPISENVPLLRSKAARYHSSYFKLRVTILSNKCTNSSRELVYRCRKGKIKSVRNEASPSTGNHIGKGPTKKLLIINSRKKEQKAERKH